MILSSLLALLNLRFIWIQTYRIFYISRRLFAKHHTISSWNQFFCSRSKSRKIRILSIWSFLFIVVIVMSLLLKTAFWQTSIHSQYWWNVCSDRARTKSLLRRLKNIGMVSEKLYRNTLMTFHSILKPCTKSVLNFPTYFDVSGLFLKRWQFLEATYCASQKILDCCRS